MGSGTVGSQIAGLNSLPNVGFVVGPAGLWEGSLANIHEATGTGDGVDKIDSKTIDWFRD